MLLEAATAVGCCAAGVMTYAVRGRSAQLLAPSVWHGPRGRKAIALTFDDGPSESTPLLLDLLDQYQAKATFFQIGKQVERLPQVARLVVERGHEIGNHTYSHSPLYLRHRQFIADEIALGQATIEQAAAVRPVLFRAPFGCRWFGLREAQLQNRLMGVMWTTSSRDWKLPADAVYRRLKAGIGNGAIMLLHDGRELQHGPDITNTIEALKRLLPELGAQGYHAVTVSDLICQNPQLNA